MHALYSIAQFLHLVGGAVGLVLVPVPLLVKKGGPLHKRVGKVFVVAMTIAGWTGLAMALSWLIAPQEFRPARMAEAAPDVVRASGLFLGTIALITLSAIRQRMRAPTRKRETVVAPSRIDRALPLVTTIAGVATASTGILHGRGLLIGFGALAVFVGTTDLRFVLRPLESRMAWWYQHMRGAMVAVISALTAFLVFGGRRWLADLVPENWRWILWFAPALVIVPATQLWIASYKRRFAERR
jgi:hypothetical protein